MIKAERNFMSSTFSKEFRPLLPAAAVAILGTVVPASNELSAMLGALAFFGGFAVLAAMTFGLEFQQRTLGLLLGQPVERSRIWQDKLLVVFLVALILALLNWRVQQLLSELEPVALLTVWMGLVATVSAFVWLGRSFWKGALLKTGACAFLILLLSAGSQFLATRFSPSQDSGADLCFVAIFLLATACSAGFWSLFSHTTIGGAALCVASEFIAGVIVVLGLALLYGEDADISQSRFLGPLALLLPAYCALFLWLGWRKFARLELRETPSGENLVRDGGMSYTRPWLSGWLRCRAKQGLLNLVRKELRLQKPLLTLAGLFFVLWLAACCLQWVHPGYAQMGNIVICFYAPVALLLAGCVSLGDEKALGLTAWHLALPISIQIQWLVKLVVAAATGVVLGLVLPLCLHLLSVAFRTGRAPVEFPMDACLVVAIISGTLFILSFWTGTLLNNTVRAALSAVMALIALVLCVALGIWCAEHLELLRSVVSPLVDWFVVPASELSGVEKPGETALFLGLTAGAGVALLQSLRYYQRIRLPTKALIQACLVLASVFVLLGFILSSIDHLARA